MSQNGKLANCGKYFRANLLDYFSHLVASRWLLLSTSVEEGTPCSVCFHHQDLLQVEGETRPDQSEPSPALDTLTGQPQGSRANTRVPSMEFSEDRCGDATLSRSYVENLDSEFGNGKKNLKF